MESFLYAVFKIAIVALQVYFVFYTCQAFFYALGAFIFKFTYRPLSCSKTPLTRFALMIPAYRATRQILHVVNACLKQDYPNEAYDVFVLAQNCDSELIHMLENKECIVWEKSFEDCPGNPYLYALNDFITSIENYAKSHSNFYDAVVLIDKDNLLHKNFLQIMHERFRQGYPAIQGRRRPFNLNTPAACFDYITEVMNDYMFRAGKAGFSLLVEISGSGMVFQFDLYKTAIRRVDLQSPVHDKAFLIELIKLNTQIFYEPCAMLFEEKTDTYHGMARQRLRWIGGQFYLFRRYFLQLCLDSLKQRKLTPIDFAFSLFKIPRSLHVTGLLFWSVLGVLFPSLSLLSYKFWFAGFILYVILVLIFLFLDHTPRVVYKALLQSPLYILTILKATILSFIKNIEGTFIATDHNKETSIDEIQDEYTKL